MTLTSVFPVIQDLEIAADFLCTYIVLCCILEVSLDMTLTSMFPELQDLEIAADFHISTNIPELFAILKASDHVRVLLPHQKLDKMIFVPEGTSENPK